jgi:hypothetical protein
MTNGVFSTESIPDIDAIEYDTLFDDSTVDVIPVLVAAAAGDGTLDTAAAVHAFCSVDCTAQVVTALLITPATTMPTLPWASVISAELSRTTMTASMALH